MMYASGTKNTLLEVDCQHYYLSKALLSAGVKGNKDTAHPGCSELYAYSYSLIMHPLLLLSTCEQEENIQNV